MTFQSKSDPVPPSDAAPFKPCCAASRARSGALPAAPPSAHVPAAAPAPRATVAFPAVAFLMGTDYAHANHGDGEGPVRPVALSPFALDAYPVTNADFAAFVRATGYVTESERYGTSFVFQGQIPDGRYEELVEDTLAAAPWWCLVRGASWRAPEGPGSGIAGRMTHPVVHVSWHDAMAYAAWSGATLPTEVELHAVPNDWGPGLSRYRYVYSGDDVVLVEPSTRRVIQVIE